jgi:hypothetical protein
LLPCARAQATNSGTVFAGTFSALTASTLGWLVVMITGSRSFTGS